MHFVNVLRVLFDFYFCLTHKLESTFIQRLNISQCFNESLSHHITPTLTGSHLRVYGVTWTKTILLHTINSEYENWNESLCPQAISVLSWPHELLLYHPLCIVIATSVIKAWSWRVKKVKKKKKNKNKYKTHIKQRNTQF